MATDMGRACDDDEVDELEEEDRPRCDGCGGILVPWDAELPVIYYCFHALHAGCAHERDACPRCQTPRWVPNDDDQSEPVDEAAAASPPGNNPDVGSALASDGMGAGNDDDDDRPRGGGETGEHRPPSRCDGESPASMSVSGCNHASRHGCCSRRVTELESRLEEKNAALTNTTNFLESELERSQSRLCRLEEMYDKLEGEFVRLREDKRAREIEDADERKKLRNGGSSVVSSFPQDQAD